MCLWAQEHCAYVDALIIKFLVSLAQRFWEKTWCQTNLPELTVICAWNAWLGWTSIGQGECHSLPTASVGTRDSHQWHGGKRLNAHLTQLDVAYALGVPYQLLTFSISTFSVDVWFEISIVAATTNWSLHCDLAGRWWQKCALGSPRTTCWLWGILLGIYLVRLGFAFTQQKKGPRRTESKDILEVIQTLM